MKCSTLLFIFMTISSSHHRHHLITNHAQRAAARVSPCSAGFSGVSCVCVCAVSAVSALYSIPELPVLPTTPVLHRSAASRRLGLERVGRTLAPGVIRAGP